MPWAAANGDEQTTTVETLLRAGLNYCSIWFSVYYQTSRIDIGMHPTYHERVVMVLRMG